MMDEHPSDICWSWTETVNAGEWLPQDPMPGMVFKTFETGLCTFSVADSQGRMWRGPANPVRLTAASDVHVNCTDQGFEAVIVRPLPRKWWQRRTRYEATVYPLTPVI